MLSVNGKTGDPMNETAKILMVEDSQSLAAIYSSYLNNQAFEILIVDSLAAARSEWERMQPDLVLLDVELPDGNGLDLLRERPVEENAADVVIMTAFGSTDSAVEAINMGAVDYLSKPFDADRLNVTVANALKNRQLRSAVDEYSSLNRREFCDFIGRSLPMQSIYRIIDSVAVSDATAFIVGDSGTGKELTASAIHQLSQRASQPFHAINCGAIPGELMESELFGHVKGAFTGAISSRDGAASVANGGTLFLDEICEMDLELQKKMLRFIQTGEFQRVGSNRVERADIRFVCATNKDPLAEVREGRFREDLFYRLHVVPIHLPPLKDRGQDILDIAETFLEKFSERDGKAFTTISDDARTVLLSHHWPGNVRELQNVIQHAVVLNDGNSLTADMLQLGNLTSVPPVEPVIRDAVVETVRPVHEEEADPVELISRWEIEPLWVTERRTIEAAIASCDGNINKAAGFLEVAPSTIYRKLQAWEAKDLANKDQENRNLENRDVENKDGHVRVDTHSVA